MRITACVLAALAVAASAAWAQPGGGAATRPIVLPTRPVLKAPPSTGPAGRVAASTRFSAVPRELVERWAALKEKRAGAVAFARKVEEQGVPEARQNFNELKRQTAEFNAAIAPYAEASPMKYPSPMPRAGAGEAVWFYKACRAIEKYNAAHEDWTDGPSYAVHRMTNEYREALGLMPLEMDERLIDSARGHSSWMAQTGTFEHESDLPGKKTPDQRMTAAGYKWRGCAENIASGQPTAEVVFKSWFDSYHHHHNLVGNYTHLGVANVQDYWTQNFAIGEPVKSGR